MNYLQPSLRRLAIITLALSTISFLSAQVVVNEFSAANYDHFSFGEGEWELDYEDWIELYNPTLADINLEGHWLSDDTNDPQKWAFPAATNIEAQGYLVVVLSGMGDFSPNENGNINANFKIKQTAGEEIVFSAPDGTLLESFDFDDIGANRLNHSFARIADGDGEWQICTSPTVGESNTGPFGTSYAVAPEMDMLAGFYEGPVVVTITSEDPNAIIYYTLDGSEPMDDDAIYNSPITLNESDVIRAIGYSDDLDILPSFIRTNTYLISEGVQTLPVVCLSGETIEDGFWGSDKKIGVVEIFDSEGSLLSKAHGEVNESGSDSNAFNQKGFDFITEDEMGHDHHVEHPLFYNTERDEFQRLIFKAGGSDNYPQSNNGTHMKDVFSHQLSIKAGLEIDVRSDAFCVVYFNGTYRGLYSMREKVDDLDYFDYYYDQPEGSVDYIKTWGGTWNEYGTYDNWQEVQDYVAENSFCDGDNYDWVTDRIEVSSFTDFYILNSFLVNHAWLNWDNSWWRGYDPDGGALKWRFALWDMDFAFTGINFLGIPDTTPLARPCDFQTLGDPGGAGHIPLINNLFSSPEFESQFAYRYQELANSYFSCEYMNSLIDSIENVMLPEMPRHVDHWGGSVDEWQEHIQLTRDFIDARCGDVILALIDSCWNTLPNTDFDLTLIVDGSGSVQLNELLIDEDSSPYTAIDEECSYLVELEAINGDDLFVIWEIVNGDLVFDDWTNPIQSFTFDQDIELIAHFDTPDGINEILSQSVTLYPNPTTQQFSIESDIAINQIEIVDATGRIAMTIHQSENFKEIDISKLQAGLYSVNIYHALGQMTKILYVID